MSEKVLNLIFAANKNDEEMETEIRRLGTILAREIKERKRLAREFENVSKQNEDRGNFIGRLDEKLKTSNSQLERATQLVATQRSSLETAWSDLSSISRSQQSSLETIANLQSEIAREQKLHASENGQHTNEIERLSDALKREQESKQLIETHFRAALFSQKVLHSARVQQLNEKVQSLETQMKGQQEKFTRESNIQNARLLAIRIMYEKKQLDANAGNNRLNAVANERIETLEQTVHSITEQLNVVNAENVVLSQKLSSEQQRVVVMKSNFDAGVADFHAQLDKVIELHKQKEQNLGESLNESRAKIEEQITINEELQRKLDEIQQVFQKKQQQQQQQKQHPQKPQKPQKENESKVETRVCQKLLNERAMPVTPSRPVIPGSTFDDIFETLQREIAAKKSEVERTRSELAIVRQTVEEKRNNSPIQLQQRKQQSEQQQQQQQQNENPQSTSVVKQLHVQRRGPKLQRQNMAQNNLLV